MWNNFIVRRSCFRAFTKYYRKQFSDRNKKFQKKRALKKKRLEMLDLVREFCREEFPALLERMNERQKEFLEEAVLTVLHCHRYKKQEGFLSGIDFTIVRDCMYKYTQDARERFMDGPAFAFLFTHFYEQGAVAFLQEKDREVRDKNFVEELEKELKSLNREALKSMNKDSATLHNSN